MQSQQIKLSCRNVWKIYGDNPEKFFNNQITKLSAPLKYAKEIQQENHIVANADVSFDVHVGD